MKAIVLSILISCFLAVQQCQSLEEKLSGFMCPDSSDTSLVTTVVSGCKVYYTCKNAVVTKIFQCSESQLLTGATHVCHEDPQCPGIDSFEELKNLPTTIEESKASVSAIPVTPTDVSENSTSMIDTIFRFSICALEAESIDEFSNKCVYTILFQKKSFMEVEVSPNVLAYEDIISQLKAYDYTSKTSERKEYERIPYPSLGKVLNGIIGTFAPQCEVICKDAAKPQKIAKDLPSEQISLEDTKPLGDHLPDLVQVLGGDRVRRSPITPYDMLRNILMPNSMQVIPTEPPVDDVNDNRTLMSEVIVPVIKDFVNDEEALKNTTNLVRVVFEAVVPLATEILKASNDSFNLDRKPVLKIPRQIFQSAVRKVYDDGLPILRSILVEKLPSILRLLSRNTKLMFRSWNEMESRLEPNMKKLVSTGFELFKKYYSMFRSSTPDFIHTYSLIEIQQDIELMYSLLPEVSKGLVLKNWSVFQDVSGITTDSISKMLLDVPGIFDAINAIPFEYYIYFFFLFV